MDILAVSNIFAINAWNTVSTSSIDKLFQVFLNLPGTGSSSGIIKYLRYSKYLK